MLRNCCWAVVGASGVLTAAHSRADLIAADSFLSPPVNAVATPANGEYIVTAGVNQLRRSTTNGAGQNPTVLGFSGAWTGNVTSGSLAVAQWTAEQEGLDLIQVAYDVDGRARFAGVDNLQRRVQRALTPYTPSNSYYLSLASQVLTGDTDGDGFVGIGFTNSNASVAQADANIASGNGLRGLLIGAAGDGANTDYVVRHVGSTGVVQNDVILDNIVQNDSAGSPIIRYTVLKIEFNDDPFNPLGNSKLTIWQDPTDVSSEAAASISVTPLVLRTFALSSAADLTHLTLTGLDYSRPASFDEPRLATNWNDVIGAAIPEPSSAWLVGGLLMSMAAIRLRASR